MILGGYYKKNLAGLTLYPDGLEEGYLLNTAGKYIALGDPRNLIVRLDKPRGLAYDSIKLDDFERYYELAHKPRTRLIKCIVLGDYTFARDGCNADILTEVTDETTGN